MAYENQFTHYANLYGVPILYNPKNGDMEGRYWWCDYLIWLLVKIDISMRKLFPKWEPKSFPLQITGKIK